MAEAAQGMVSRTAGGSPRWTRDLGRSLARWVDEGLLSDAQAAAIREREAAVARAAPLHAVAGVPIVTEILGYVGGALGVGAIVALMANWWDRLGVVGHVGLPGLVAVATLVAGLVVGRGDASSARRLAQFLLLLGVTASGFAAGIVYHDACCGGAAAGPAQDREHAWTNLSGWIVASLVGGAVFRLHRTGLQHAAFGVAVGGACLALGAVGGDATPIWLRGSLLAAVAVAWGVASETGRVTPTGVGLALASFGLLLGIVLAGDDPGHELPTGTIVTAMLASLALLGASWRLRRGVLLGFGAGGVVVFLPWLLASIFGRTIGVPIAVLSTGVLLVTAAVAVARALPRLRAR